MKQRNIEEKDTIFLIDGSSFLYRAYYSMRPLHTTAGDPVHAVYGFCRMLKKIIDTLKPSYLGLVWDSKGKTTRHELFAAYKATRQAAPTDLSSQKDLIKEFAEIIGLSQLAKEGIEADDIIFSLAKKFSKKNCEVVLVGPDKDFGQVLDEQIKIYDPIKNVFITQESFEKSMGFPSKKLPFYFSLVGDASDNIPGVKGIGKKRATQLVQQFASLQEMYEKLDTVSTTRVQNALKDGKEDAFLSYDLFLPQQVAINIAQQNLVFDKNNWSKAREFFSRLQFNTLIKDIEKHTTTEDKTTRIKKYGYDLRTVTTQKELDELIAHIKDKKICAVDTELDGAGSMQASMVGMSISTQEGTAYYVPFGHTSSTNQLLRADVFKAFQPIFFDASIKKVMHHAKFDLLVLASAGLPVKGLYFDTLVAAHLVTEDWQRIGLKYLSEYYLNEVMLTFNDVVLSNNLNNFAQVPLGLATHYAAMDAHQTLRLMPLMHQKLEKYGMVALYKEIEFPLIEVLFAMENEGIFLDTEILEQVGSSLNIELAHIKDKLQALLGADFEGLNINSPKQLSQLLFEHLQLPPQKKTTGKTGYSTDQEVLEILAEKHPVPALIMKYRELFKLKTTYVDALPAYINPQTGKIHTTFTQTAVATGRLASSSPNLQNIPLQGNVRQAFKPDDGNLFISADYSQIELRVLAFLSQDEHLVKAFLRGEDIHKNTAANIFGVLLEQVNDKQRQIGKRINFSIMYGLTPYGLSKDLKIPYGEAKTYIEKYFEQYPGVRLWMDNVIATAKENGYVTTYWGRRRYVPGIYESNKTLYDIARRIAINTVAQGTAAELMKKGMLSLHNFFQQSTIKLLLQIHDELLISVPKSSAATAAQQVQDHLEGIVDWNVPLKVTTRIGSNWGEVTK